MPASLSRFFLAFILNFSICHAVGTADVQAKREALTANPPTKQSLPAGVTRFFISQKIEGKIVHREVLIQTPPKIERTARYPVLFAFHGNGGLNRHFLRQMQPLVDQGEFIGVYPQGYRRSWNLGKEASTADDVAFVTEIIEKISDYEQIDTETLFAMGVSNGAALAHTLAMETDDFLAIAAIATQLTALNLPTAETREISVLQISGDRDRIIPYEGGDSPTGHLFLPAEISSQIWARHNGIEGRPEIFETADGNQKLSYDGGRKNTRVLHYRMRKHGHGGFEREEGGINRLVWDFCRQQIRRKSGE
jgi:poly(3-hydroxybutyrate) depolymerase